MDRLPQYWCIKNNYQEVRDFLAEKYNNEDYRDWTSYDYIGFDSLIHGCSLTSMNNNPVVITSIEHFRSFIKVSEIVENYPLY